MKARIFLGCVSLAVLISGCAEHRVAKVAAPIGGAAAPVIVADSVREALPNDYMRVIFVKPGTPITSFSAPTAKRTFVTATVLYSPPLTVEDYPRYSGLENDDSKVLVAMRCKPPDPEKVDAVLAT